LLAIISAKKHVGHRRETTQGQTFVTGALRTTHNQTEHWSFENPSDAGPAILLCKKEYEQSKEIGG
jgi:hypothetical protein